MTVEIEGGFVRLTGRCGVEEAETLLRALDKLPQPEVVLAAERIHTALWQVLMAARPRLHGDPGDDFVAGFLLPQMLEG